MNNAASSTVESLLAIDVGSVFTRVYLFEIANGSFRYIARGTAPTTAEAPVKDIGEGIMAAIRDLESISYRSILSPEGRFIIPSLPSGQGIDTLSATLSAGPLIKVVCAGMLADVSLESSQHLAMTTYSQVLESVSITDSRKMDEQIDSIMRILPEMIIVSGGADDGASSAMKRVFTTSGNRLQPGSTRKKTRDCLCWERQEPSIGKKPIRTHMPGHLHLEYPPATRLRTARPGPPGIS